MRQQESGKSSDGDQGTEPGGFLERDGHPGSWGRWVGRASVPRTLSKLFPYHVLGRPRFGALHPDQDRWRGPPLERPLPKEQAPPFERGPPPEQPHWMAPEQSKFGHEDQWEARVLIKDERASGPRSPPIADTPPSPRPLPHPSSVHERSAFTLPPSRRPPSPENPERDEVTADRLGLVDALGPG